MYTLAMIKSKALKGGQVAADVRSLYIRSIRSMSFPQIMMNLYPRMFGVHDLPENIGYLGPNDRLELPQFMRISHSYMVADGAYMLSRCPESYTSRFTLTLVLAQSTVKLLCCG
jgi:protein transport protein SEC24